MVNLLELKEKLEHSAAGNQWKAIGVKPHHGFAFPLFSLHSANSCGIGEFPDLLPMIDWCHSLGMDVIQLLPLNDTGHEISPYSAISAFALNPIYLGLSELPNLEEFPHLKLWLKDLQKNDEQKVHYSHVREGKYLFLREYYRLNRAQIMGTEHYQHFLYQNQWLKDYALFKALKEFHQWASWEEWEESFQNPNEDKITEFLQTHEEEIQFHSFLQYLCFQQMENCKKYATEKGVFIKGDIPILISRDSADVWRYRNLFLMQFSAGAPPDAYNSEGQNWGFPIYNWPEIEKSHFSWWKERLEVAGHFYHIYRIDHIVGFFRIWIVPPGKTGKDGKFWLEDQNTWVPHGEKIMHLKLQASQMLPIGEDLGTIPPEVRISLKNLGICGTKVMRWERNWHGDRNFIKPEDYIPESMTTVSTHDSSTLEQWWKENPEESSLYAHSRGWNYSPQLSQIQREEILRESHHTTSLFHINLLQEYLALIPGMVWGDPAEERINQPGVISDLNWTYRFRPSVEEIVTNDELAKSIKKLFM